jgi:hypothetical protein
MTGKQKRINENSRTNQRKIQPHITLEQKEEYRQAYGAKNKDAIRETKQKYVNCNKEAIRDRHAEYFNDNQENIRDKKK